MLIYFKELDLEAGYAVLAEDKRNRLVAGKPVSTPSGKSLFEALKGSSLKCWNCEREGNCWIANKGKNDKVSKPTLDLFARGNDGSYTLMTRDHIIPRSRGGNNDVENLRMACSPCNSARGNDMNAEDSAFMESNRHLILPNFVPKESAPTIAVTTASKKAKRKRKKAAAKAKRLPHLTTMLALALA